MCALFTFVHFSHLCTFHICALFTFVHFSGVLMQLQFWRVQWKPINAAYNLETSQSLFTNNLRGQGIQVFYPTHFSLTGTFYEAIYCLHFQQYCWQILDKVWCLRNSTKSQLGISQGGGGHLLKGSGGDNCCKAVAGLHLSTLNFISATSCGVTFIENHSPPIRRINSSQWHFLAKGPEKSRKGEIDFRIFLNKFTLNPVITVFTPSSLC